jgi:hypothetical protein
VIEAFDRLEDPLVADLRVGECGVSEIKNTSEAGPSVGVPSLALRHVLRAAQTCRMRLYAIAVGISFTEKNFPACLSRITQAASVNKG